MAYEIQPKLFFAVAGISALQSLALSARAVMEQANAGAVWFQALDTYNNQLSDVPAGVLIGGAVACITAMYYRLKAPHEDYRYLRNISATIAGTVAVMPVALEAAIEFSQGDSPATPAQAGLLVGSAMLTGAALIGPGIRTAPDAEL